MTASGVSIIKSTINRICALYKHTAGVQATVTQQSCARKVPNLPYSTNELYGVAKRWLFFVGESIESISARKRGDLIQIETRYHSGMYHTCAG